MKPSKRQLRELARENAKRPEALGEIPQDEWPDSVRKFGSGSIPMKVWRSRRFLAVLWVEPSDASRLSICRTDWDKGGALDGISWDDLQRLKAEAGFGDACAIEIFPPDSAVVNVANMRHLWLVSAPRFMWGYERWAKTKIAA